MKIVYFVFSASTKVNANAILQHGKKGGEREKEREMKTKGWERFPFAPPAADNLPLLRNKAGLWRDNPALAAVISQNL